MSQAKISEFKRIIKALGYSLEGLKAAYREEPAFRTEIIASLFFIPAAFILGETSLEIVALIISCALVILMELLNSAIEAVVDRVGLEHNELSGRAKDIGSAAVFVALVVMALVWIVVLLPKWV